MLAGYATDLAEIALEEMDLLKPEKIRKIFVIPKYVTESTIPSRGTYAPEHVIAVRTRCSQLAEEIEALEASLQAGEPYTDEQAGYIDSAVKSVCFIATWPDLKPQDRLALLELGAEMSMRHERDPYEVNWTALANCRRIAEITGPYATSKRASDILNKMSYKLYSITRAAPKLPPGQAQAFREAAKYVAMNNAIRHRWPGRLPDQPRGTPPGFYV